MKPILLLDLDGVLITTPSWKADQIHEDGYSAFNKTAVENLNELLANTNADIWLSSTRRMNKSLEEFNTIFSNRRIERKLAGFVPHGTLSESRLEEINAFLDLKPGQKFIIIDDDNSLQDLTEERKKYWIKTNAMIGFDKEKLQEAIRLVNDLKLF